MRLNAHRSRLNPLAAHRHAHKHRPREQTNRRREQKEALLSALPELCLTFLFVPLSILCVCVFVCQGQAGLTLRLSTLLCLSSTLLCASSHTVSVPLALPTRACNYFLIRLFSTFVVVRFLQVVLPALTSTATETGLQPWWLIVKIVICCCGFN